MVEGGREVAFDCKPSGANSNSGGNPNAFASRWVALVCSFLVIQVASRELARAQVPQQPGQQSFELPQQAADQRGFLEFDDGARLWYADTGGEGEVVVFMHAASMNGRAWLFQQPVFVESGYRVITYSRRGYRPSSSKGVEETPAADDLDQLLDHLGVRKAHLVAAAHGGSFAVDFVLSYPQRVRSLTIQSSLIGIEERQYQDMLARLLPPFFSRLPAEFKELGPAYRAGNPAGARAWLELSQSSRNNDSFSFQPRRHKVDFQVLETIHKPILIVGGGADLYAPSPLLQLQAQHLPSSKLEIIPEVGHSAYWESPEKFNRLVLEFIQAVD